MVRKEHGQHLIPILLALILITAIVQLKLNNMYLNGFIMVLDIVAIVACILAPDPKSKVNS